MPKVMSVTATVPGKEGAADKSATVNVNTGKDVKEMVEMFGDEAVASNANSNWVVTLQAAIRRGIKAGKTPEQIQKDLADAKMGVKVIGAAVDPIQASLAKFQTMSKEEQADYIKQLKEAAAAK